MSSISRLRRNYNEFYKKKKKKTDSVDCTARNTKNLEK